MKKLLLVITIALLATFGLAKAADVVYNGYLVNDPGLAYANDYALETNRGGTTGTPIGSLSFEAAYSVGVFPAVTFTDGKVSTATITVASTTTLTGASATNTVTVCDTHYLTGQNATNYITITSTIGLSGASLNVNGTILKEGTNWYVNNLATTTAASLASAVNAVRNIDANAVSNVVYSTVTIARALGNTYTMVSSLQSSMTVAGATYSGGRDPGLDNAYLTVNGTRLSNGYQWQVASTSSGTATNIAAAMAKLAGISANAVSSVVYATATTPGAAGNAFTLVSSSPGYLTAGGATFSGGQSSATVTINGVVLTQGIDWTAQSTASMTARAISNAIMANSSLNTLMRSTWTFDGVVGATTTAVGAVYSLSSSIPANLVVPASFSGGSASAWTINQPTITIANHGLTTGLAVLYSTASAIPAIGGLSFGTTYYAVKIDANSFKLATTSTGAIAGAYVTLTSSSTTGPRTYTLAPLSISGTFGFKWQVSNDGVNYVDISSNTYGVGLSSVTFGTPYTAGSRVWDFGPFNYRYIRAKTAAGTQGGWSLQIIGNGKQ